MKTDKSIKEIAQEHLPYMKILEQVGSFAVFLSDRFGHIKTPEDMKGLKLRVPTSQLYTFTIEAMGGNPVAMPYPDTYAALQQGVIDGLEGSILSYQSYD